jgi:hypothetical protein
MKQLIEFPLENGNTVLVEVETQNHEKTSGPTRISRAGKVIEQAQKSFDDALEKIQPIASSIIGKVRNLSDSPDEVEVKFGFNMNADAGAVIASAGAEANFEITLKWSSKA